MAELTITAASVLATGTFSKTMGITGSGVTVTQGQVVYMQTDNTMALAQNDGTAVESGSGATTMGIVLGGASPGQYFVYLTGGTITIGATVVLGTYYYVGATAGSISLFSDIGTGGTKYVTVVGYATSTTVLSVSFNATGSFKA